MCDDRSYLNDLISVCEFLRYVISCFSCDPWCHFRSAKIIRLFVRKPLSLSLSLPSLFSSLPLSLCPPLSLPLFPFLSLSSLCLSPHLCLSSLSLSLSSKIRPWVRPVVCVLLSSLSRWSCLLERFFFFLCRRMAHSCVCRVLKSF